jgi:hypothetical protein
MNWNSLRAYSNSVGATLPVLAEPCLKKQHGAVVSNDLVLGERVAAGTPMYFDLSARTAKLLKEWKVKSATVDGDNTIIVLYKTHISPLLANGMVVMNEPVTIDGTGKAVVVSGLVENDYDYTFTVVTANIDAVEAGDYIAQSSSATAGSGKSLFCAPNVITTENVVGGDTTLVDIPRGILYMYQNTIPYHSALVEANIQAGHIVQIVWEMFNQITS